MGDIIPFLGKTSCPQKEPGSFPSSADDNLIAHMQRMEEDDYDSSLTILDKLVIGVVILVVLMIVWAIYYYVFK